MDFPKILFQHARTTGKYSYWCCKGVDWIDLSSFSTSEFVSWRMLHGETVLFTDKNNVLLDLNFKETFGGDWISFRGFETDVRQLGISKKNESEFVSAICVDSLMWLFTSTDILFSQALADKVHAEQCDEDVFKYYNDLLLW